MPSKLSKVVVGSIALSLAASTRQRVSLEREAKTLHDVDSITSLLQDRNFDGVRSKLQDLSALTPGAADAYSSTLNQVLQDIENRVLNRIKAGQSETQGKIDSSLQGYEAAGKAADDAKKIAGDTDKQRFECVATEQGLKKDAEDARAKLASSRSTEQETCQRQEDNKDFAYAVAERMKLAFECDLGIGAQCDEALASFGGKLDEIKSAAAGELAEAKKNYNALKVACDDARKERASAQSALGQAEEAWSQKREECAQAASAHKAAKCEYGKTAKAKCSAEAAFNELIAATNEKGNPENTDSEVDRKQEWVSAKTTMCMLDSNQKKGLNGALPDSEIERCATDAEASFPGQLDRKDKDSKILAGSNPCEEGPISFFNGQEWQVPEGANPPASEYVRLEYKPTLHPKKDGWPAFEDCPAEGGENQGPGTLHLIANPANECGINWTEKYAPELQALDTQQQIGATLASWGCDRLLKEVSYSQVKLASTGALYAISYC